MDVDPAPADEVLLVEDAIALVAQWLSRANEAGTRAERRPAAQLHEVINDPAGLTFAMRFVDRVVRPEDNRVAAHQLSRLVSAGELPSFLSALDKLLLRAGARLAPLLPNFVMPLAVRRMRQLVGHLVVDADDEALHAHLRERREEGYRLNVNMLGEAVLGKREAERRYHAAAELLRQPDVDYVSVKISAIVAQLNPWDHEGSIQRVVERLRPLLLDAAQTAPPTFVNLDMEEYRDLDLTKAVFMRLLDEPELHTVDAGIVLQTYLPDSFAALQELVTWANRRHDSQRGGRRGGVVKIRLVKGANLAMERVDAAMHGWVQAPYATKAEVDANYKRCLDWVLTPQRMRGVRVGLASHNLFDVAWGHLLSERRGVADALEFEMLQGMAPALARVARDDGGGLLLYTPIVARDDFDVAISYLFRRLEENSSADNFLRHLFSIELGSPAFTQESDRFRAAVADRTTVSSAPRRTQDRRAPKDATPAVFENEPDTDPALSGNREWIQDVLRRPAVAPSAPLMGHTGEVDDVVARATEARHVWAALSAAERRDTLWAVASELARRRGDLVAAMVQEGAKTIGQADPEVSEAIDFARWYGDRALELERSPSARFEPLGVVAVVPPWNFPVAIPAGGVLAALAAGNAALLKPAPETPRCAEIIIECCDAAGVGDAAQLVRVPDDDVGRHLITHPDIRAVILTGAYETAERFRSWKPDLRLFAETSGKNAMVITPHADIDLAVADLVASAFGHSGQKCSAASLAICVGDVYESPRFRRQLVDAVTSLAVGRPDEPGTTMGPTIHEPEGKLQRGLTNLDPGEKWLVPPARLGERLWSPGVRLGVEAGSWFHQTECFGPVLGVMAARDLDHATELQNGTGYGLTGGIHTLDPDEVELWLDAVEVGNAYINRQTTGAIVRRQPFGGWKRSVIGPGAKAGGPNYVAQLGHWLPTDAPGDGDGTDAAAWLAAAASSDQLWWDREFSIGHDPTALFCESNVFRYRPLPLIGVRAEPGHQPWELERVRNAAAVCGVPTVVSSADDESVDTFSARLGGLGVARVRVIGQVAPALRTAANTAGIHLADAPVTGDGRIELLHYLREQAVSRTLHRYGNLV